MACGDGMTPEDKEDYGDSTVTIAKEASGFV
jgi:hypothetical protein